MVKEPLQWRSHVNLATFPTLVLSLRRGAEICSHRDRWRPRSRSEHYSVRLEPNSCQTLMHEVHRSASSKSAACFLFKEAFETSSLFLGGDSNSGFVQAPVDHLKDLRGPESRCNNTSRLNCTLFSALFLSLINAGVQRWLRAAFGC